MLLTIRCWIVQMLMPKELRIYFQLFLNEKLKKMEQELEDIAYGKAESEGQGMIYDMEEIKALIAGYVEKHPLAEKCGGEYIWQDDKAQEDAIKLVADIFDNMES